jgi:hypothetical protein
MNHEWTSINVKIDRSSKVTEGTLELPDALKAWTKHGVLAVHWSDKGDTVAAQLRPKSGTGLVPLVSNADYGRIAPKFNDGTLEVRPLTLREQARRKGNRAALPLLALAATALAFVTVFAHSPSDADRRQAALQDAVQPVSGALSAVTAQPAAVRRATRKTGDQLKDATSALSQAQKHQLATSQPLVRQATSAVQRARVSNSKLATQAVTVEPDVATVRRWQAAAARPAPSTDTGLKDTSAALTALAALITAAVAATRAVRMP